MIGVIAASASSAVTTATTASNGRPVRGASSAKTAHGADFNAFAIAGSSAASVQEALSTTGFLRTIVFPSFAVPSIGQQTSAG
jgi:hypothetical protein